MKKKKRYRWRKLPEAHDYPAAESYLGLFYDEPTVARLVKKLRSASIREFKSKDIFRASGLALLPWDNFHVRADRKKILKGEKVSPLLLVQDPGLAKVIIADGYHRLCAVYWMNEDAVVPCKIV